MSYIFNSCRPHHKKGNLIRGFLFCFTEYRQELRGEPRTGVSALPYGLVLSFIVRQSWQLIIAKRGAPLKAQFLSTIYKGAIPGRSFLAIPSLRSLRPYQNEAIMRNERINARFFCMFDVFMRSKTRFFAIYPPFWRPFWRPHLS